MTQLHLEANPWSTGSGWLGHNVIIPGLVGDGESTEHPCATVVRCCLGDMALEEEVLLDTGAPFSILPAYRAREPEIAPHVQWIDREEKVSWRGERWSGPLARIPLRLVAQRGRHLDVEGTFLVLRDFPS